MSNNHIRIPNCFVQEYKYTNETVFIYSLIQEMLNFRGQIIFNLDWLFKNLKIKGTNTFSRNRIKSILEKLEEDNYIDLCCNLNKIDKNTLIIAPFTEIESEYVQILDYEFDIINDYNYQNNVDRYKIFCVFANIKSRIDFKGKGYCYPNFETIKKNIGINSDTSIHKYLNILRDDLRLILYDNPGEIVVKDKDDNYKVTQSNNIYVMNNSNGQEILAQAIINRKTELTKFYGKLKNDAEINKRRSNSMKEYWRQEKNNDLFKDVEDVID